MKKSLLRFIAAFFMVFSAGAIDINQSINNKNVKTVNAEETKTIRYELATEIESGARYVIQLGTFFLGNTVSSGSASTIRTEKFIIKDGALTSSNLDPNEYNYIIEKREDGKFLFFHESKMKYIYNKNTGSVGELGTSYRLSFNDATINDFYYFNPIFDSENQAWTIYNSDQTHKLAVFSSSTSYGTIRLEPILSTKNSTAKIYKVIETDFIKTELRSQIGYNCAINEDESMTFSNLKLNFGVIIENNSWNYWKKESTIIEYGVYVCLKSSLENDAVNDSISSAVLNNKSYLKKGYSTNIDSIQPCDRNGKGSEGVFRIWSVNVSVPFSKIHDTFVAAAYIKTNDGIIFTDEREESISSMAQKYCAMTDFYDSLSQEQQLSLAELAK